MFLSTFALLCAKGLIRRFFFWIWSGKHKICAIRVWDVRWCWRVVLHPGRYAMRTLIAQFKPDTYVVCDDVVDHHRHIWDVFDARLEESSRATIKRCVTMFHFWHADSTIVLPNKHHNTRYCVVCDDDNAAWSVPFGCRKLWAYKTQNIRWTEHTCLVYLYICMRANK